MAPAITGTPDFSHLSIELGRFSPAEIVDDLDLVRRRCRQASHWLAGARASADSGHSPLRTSTCILLDDYPGEDADPATVFGNLLAATEAANLTVDYIARTAGLTAGEPDDLTVALVAARLVDEPAPGSNGTRPAILDSGWLCNGQRSADPYGAEAMQARSWVPPYEYAAAGHSIFMDVELWRDEGPGAGPESQTSRHWSPAILAASWLLLRLGLLHGIATRAVEPVPHPPKTGWPRDWDNLPAVIKVTHEASPMAAYRALSIAPQSDLPLEHATRLILDAFAVDPKAAARLESHASEDGLDLEPEISGRLGAILYPLESR